MMTTAKCNGEGRLRRLSVAVVATIAVVVIRGLPPGQLSRQQGAPSKDDRDEQQ